MLHLGRATRWASPQMGWADMGLGVMPAGVLGGCTATSHHGCNEDLGTDAASSHKRQHEAVHHHGIATGEHIFRVMQVCSREQQSCTLPFNIRPAFCNPAAVMRPSHVAALESGMHTAASRRGGGVSSTLNQSSYMHFSSSSSNSSSRPSAELQHLLLEHGLKHVSTHGWTMTAMQAAAKELGMSPAVVGMLPRGESHLVEHFVHACNQQLEQQLSNGALTGLKSQAKLAMALRLRLSMLQPHINSWPQALAVLSRPTNLPHALALLHQLVDDVWVAAGDTSTDTSWYTKRAALAGVYTSTELYMLTDFSQGFEDTWQALDRRLEDAAMLGKVSAGMQAAWQQVLKQTAADLGLRQHTAAPTTGSLL